MTVYINDDFKISQVMKEWYTGSVGRISSEVEAEVAGFDVIILVSDWPGYTDFVRSAATTWFERERLRLLWVVHEPDLDLTLKHGASEWQTLIFKHGMVDGRNASARLQLFTIAPSVSAYTQSLLQTWARGLNMSKSIDVPWIVPLFPLPPAPAQNHSDICIQGTIDSRRRNYDGAFAAMRADAVLARLQMLNESLLLVGKQNGNLTLPSDLINRIRVVSGDIPYQDFYSILRRCRALLTAFATEINLVSRASSTIAAALQVGVPLLGEARVLRTYSFLDEHAMLTFDPPANATWPDNAAEGARAAMQQLGMAARHASAGTELRRQAPAYAPRNITYADALLTALDAAQVAAAHDAAQRLKSSIMERNVEVARQFLADTAQLKLRASTIPSARVGHLGGSDA